MWAALAKRTRSNVALYRSVNVLFSAPKKFARKLSGGVDQHSKQLQQIKRILFFGSDEFSISTLKYLLKIDTIDALEDAENDPLEKNINPPIVGHRDEFEIEIVTKPNKVSGTKILRVPIVDFAEKYSITYHQPEKLKSWTIPLATRSNEPFDLAVAVSFGSLIPSNVISSFPRGGINLHPSLLPRHRGPAPLHHTILCEDTQTGITIIELHPLRFDEGKILLQQKLDIPRNITFPELSKQLCLMGSEALLDVLRNFDSYSRKAFNQSHEGISYAPKLTKSMGAIQWDHQTAHVVRTLWRALGSTIGIHFSMKGKRVKAVELDLSITKNVVGLKSGASWYDRQTDSIAVVCASNPDGSKGVIFIKKLVVAGKNKAIYALPFANGYKLPKGDGQQFYTFNDGEIL